MDNEELQDVDYKKKMLLVTSSSVAMVAIVALLAVDITEAVSKDSNSDLCEEFAAQNKEHVRDISNIDAKGRSVFRHPEGHVCAVYPKA